MAAAATQWMTAEELFRLPEDGVRRELVRGELIVTSPVGFQHSKVVTRLGGILDRYVSERGLGEVGGGDVGFVLERNPDTVRAPDIAFVCQAKIDQIADRNKYLSVIPDLIVEVLSPSDSHQAMEEKAETFLRAGTSLVWIVNPNRTGLDLPSGSKASRFAGR